MPTRAGWGGGYWFCTEENKKGGFYIASGNTLQSPCWESHTVFENPVPCETCYHEEPFVSKSCCPFFTPRHRWTQASPPGICEQLMDKWILSPFLAPLVTWSRSQLSSLCCRCSGTGVGSAKAGGGCRDRWRAARI